MHIYTMLPQQQLEVDRGDMPLSKYLEYVELFKSPMNDNQLRERVEALMPFCATIPMRLPNSSGSPFMDTAAKVIARHQCTSNHTNHDNSHYNRLFKGYCDMIDCKRCNWEDERAIAMRSSSTIKVPAHYMEEFHHGRMDKRKYAAILEACEAPISVDEYMKYSMRCIRDNAFLPRHGVAPSSLARVIATTPTREYHRGTMPKSEHDEMIAACKQPVTLAQCMQYFEVCIKHAVDIPYELATIALPILTSVYLHTPAYDNGTVGGHEHNSRVEKLEQPLPRDQCMKSNNDREHEKHFTDAPVVRAQNSLNTIVTNHMNDRGTMSEIEYANIVEALKRPMPRAEYRRYAAICKEHGARVPPRVTLQPIDTTLNRPPTREYINQADIDKFIRECTWPKAEVSLEALYAEFVRITSSNKPAIVVSRELGERGYIIEIIEKKQPKTIINGKSSRPSKVTYKINPKYVK